MTPDQWIDFEEMLTPAPSLPRRPSMEVPRTNLSVRSCLGVGPGRLRLAGVSRF